MSDVKQFCMPTFEAKHVSRYRRAVSADSSQQSGQRIRDLRVAKRMTQQELADAIGKKRSQVVEWEAGKGLNEENLRLVSGALGVKPGEIGKPWRPGNPRPHRRALQKSRPVADSLSVAPPHEESVLMNGGLPIPDQDLFGEVIGAWRMLRGEEDRRHFVAHVREYMAGYLSPARPRTKNHRR